MTDAQDLQETTVEAALSEAQVDADSGVISDVAVIGTVSQNGRRYQRSALKEATSLYSGVKVFLDHEEGDPMDRSVRDLVGRLKRPRFAGGKVKADLQVLSHEPERSLLTSLAEEMPDAVGLSHSARGKVKQAEDGTQVVTEITRVNSVDLVAEPATTSSLFESVQRGHSLDRGREALESVGAEEDLLEEIPTFHLESIGAPDDSDEREARARELIESVDASLGRSTGASTTGRPKSRERDPDEMFDDGTERYDESELGWAHEQLMGF